MPQYAGLWDLVVAGLTLEGRQAAFGFGALGALGL